MFERFTDRGRRVVILAQEEARMMNHNYIGTEHILLGLIHEGQNIAARALESLGVGLQPARLEVEGIIGRGQKPPSGHVPFTPRAKKVLELSLREALHLDNNFIGPEHILLGTLREGDGVAVQVLVRLGADLNRVRQQVIQLTLAESQEGQAEGAGPGAPRTASEGVGVPAAPWSSRDVWQMETLQTLSRIADRLDAIERHLGMKGDADAEGEPGAEEDQPGGAKPEGKPGSAEEAGE